MPAAPKPEKKPKRNPRAEWRATRDAWLATHPTCEMPEPVPVAHGGGIQVHHVEPRGMGGSRRTDLTLATLCQSHHAYVEANREWARLVGMLTRKQ